MARPPNLGAGSQPVGSMTDHLQLMNQLAHHDAAIASFGGRMTAVESTLGHVQDKLSNVDNRMMTGFEELKGMMQAEKAAHGPGLSDSIKMTAGLLSIGAAAVISITFLVTSLFEPQLLNVSKTTDTLVDFRRRDEDERRREHEKLRDERKAHQDRAIEELRGAVQEMQTNKAWNQITIKKAGS